MTGQPTPKGAWKITFLLFLFMVVNFADKIVVGLAGVPIMNDLKLDAGQFGELGSSFFLLFSISAIIVGFIVERLGVQLDIRRQYFSSEQVARLCKPRP